MTLTDADLLDNFSFRLEELRQERSMTHVQFSEWLNVNRTSLEAYRFKRCSPNALVLAHIARRCHVSMDWLFGMPKKPKYPSVEQERAAIKEIRAGALSKLSTLEVKALMMEKP